MALSLGFPVWVALIAIALLVTMTLWANQQTYTLQRVGRDWQVSAIDLAASARAECPTAA